MKSAGLIAAIATLISAIPLAACGTAATNSQSTNQTQGTAQTVCTAGDVLCAWQHGGSSALLTAPTGSGTQTSSYAVMQFPSLGYTSSISDGAWDLLRTAGMVHIHGTPTAGQQGNMIVGFHREPTYQNIDQLNSGDLVTIGPPTGSPGITYTYKVTQRWVIDPTAITNQLDQTSGHDLTLVTGTPFWQDTQVIILRAELIS